MAARAALRLARRPSGRVLAFTAWAGLVAAALAGAVAIRAALPLQVGPDEFSIPAWETRNLPAKWLYLFGALFRNTPSPPEEDEALLRFFDLSREINGLERQLEDARQRQTPSDALQRQLDARRRERDRAESGVEATIEGRITAVAEEQGIERSLLFGRIVWPPVDFEFTTSPRTLATSPRDRIELRSTTLLRAGLSLAEAVRIEDDAASRDGVSALAFPTSGVGAYPTIVGYTTDYRSTLEVVAHEWTHNYLAFRPLGFSYFKDNDLRTMNETVADLVGREIADDVIARWPLDEPRRPPATPPAVDVGQALRDLRRQVDVLLARGEVDAAERLMEERRQLLADNGYQVRKINQAYFAFTNLYAGEAGSPGATNPIGPKIDELRRRSGSLGQFLRVVGGLTSTADLDRALAALAP